jgi:TetR/AcrR family transcriptional regulator, cholesterol catabolism regulator
MARPRKQDIQSDNRREDLILKAARLFRHKGYHGTSMRDIAAATGMRPGSPFYHFATKQDLLFAGVRDGMLSCLKAMERIDAAGLPAAEHFRQLARTHVGFLLDMDTGNVPMVVDEWQHLEGDQRQEILALRRRYERLWLDAFERLNQAGLVHRSDKRACWFFLGAMHGMRNWYRPGGPLGPEQLADQLVDWVLCVEGATVQAT